MLELLFEIILEILGEFITAAAIEVLSHALGSRRRAVFAMAVPGWAILGGVSGMVTAAVAPNPLIPYRGPHGLSLLISPFVTGYLMKTLGDFWREYDRDTTMLATFWGGYVFALSLSLVRLLLVR